MVERTFSPKTKETLPCAGLLLYVHKSKHEKASTVIGTGFQAGDPREIRTPDTLIRSQVLYPAELLGQIGRGRGTQTPNLRFWRPLLYQLRYAPRRMFLATVLS